MCLGIEKKILDSGGLDATILGLGINGHIGFNEPGSSLDSRTRIVELTEETIERNTIYFEDPAMVPVKGLTLGIGSLKKSRKTLLIVNGGHKARILANAIEGTKTQKIPATFLRDFQNVTVMVDEDAAVYLTGK
jgi:glucosamine-6-phosphate deaminase